MLLKPCTQLHVHAYARRGVASPAEPGGRDKRGLNPQFSVASVRYEFQNTSNVLLPYLLKQTYFITSVKHRILN